MIYMGRVYKQCAKCNYQDFDLNKDCPKCKPHKVKESDKSRVE